jgi:hypothetical protein
MIICIIKPYLQQKTFLILTQLWRNSILHCENANLIKADWLTIHISLAESGNLTQTSMVSAIV